jgi:hypothetical protein
MWELWWKFAGELRLRSLKARSLRHGEQVVASHLSKTDNGDLLLKDAAFRDFHLKLVPMKMIVGGSLEVSYYRSVNI